MGFILFFVPAIVFGAVAGTMSAWWLLGFVLWEYTFGGRFAEWVNGGSLNSAGIGVFLLDIVALFVSFGFFKFLLPLI